MKKLLTRFKKWLYMFFMEFWHIKIVNGKTTYHFSSKKFHFQIAQIIFYSASLTRMFAPEEILGVKMLDRLTVEFLALLATHAGATGTWYAWRKHKDIEKQAKIDGQTGEIE